jgi:hypothetical protein
MLRLPKRLAISLFLFSLMPAAFSFDLNPYPESADRNALFINVKALSLSFSDGFGFAAQEFGFDYVQPFLLPVSLGAYFKRPDPNLKSFGIRLGYHLNINAPKTNLYFFYVFDLGFLRNDLLLEYGDEKQEMRFYDFRLGVRQRFNLICLMLESDLKLQGINIGISIKLN